MAQTIEDVNGRTLLQQFHSLYKKQDEIETNVENVDAKVEKEKSDRQSADLSINSQIQALRDQIESLGVLFTYKGEVATIQDLPVTDNKPGDVYYVDSEQSGYVWLEKSGVYQWEEFGPAIDLSEYAKQEDLEQTQSELTATDTQVKNNTTQITNLTNSKQDKLTAGDNIKIENNIISSTGGNSDALYEHNITLYQSSSFYKIYLTIICDNSNVLSISELYNLITTQNKSCSGISTSSPNRIFVAISKGTTNDRFNVSGIRIDTDEIINLTNVSFTLSSDEIRQIS